ncbi:M48 family metalloprotease [bacterium]|nr:M48 family metalloprotease [bacterium]
MHKFFLVFSLILSSCASSPVQEKGNIDKVNKIINTSPIKKPIRRTTKQSEELITKIESRINPAVETFCEERNLTCDWEISQEVNMTFNAYATIEDGQKKIVLFTGLVSGVHYEEELAFVVAHEIAHHLANHINESRITTGVGAALGGVLGAAVGLPTVGATYGAALGRLSFSVDQENEADEIATKLLKDSGYDLEKAKMVILRMARMGGGYYTEWMSSHPSGPDRILNFEERVE